MANFQPNISPTLEAEDDLFDAQIDPNEIAQAVTSEAPSSLQEERQEVPYLPETLTAIIVPSGAPAESPIAERHTLNIESYEKNMPERIIKVTEGLRYHCKAEEPAGCGQVRFLLTNNYTCLRT